MTIIKLPKRIEKFVEISQIRSRWDFWREGWTHPCSKELVKQAITLGDFLSKETTLENTENYSSVQHAARIAYLVIYGWHRAIDINTNGSFYVINGHHRLCAADYLGYKKIFAKIEENYQF